MNWRGPTFFMLGMEMIVQKETAVQLCMGYNADKVLIPYEGMNS